MAASNSLMVTVSGVRGIIGESLFPQTVVKYVSAFALCARGRRIILGRDSRMSGPWLRKLVHGTLQAHGCEVHDLGVVPTPTVQWFVKHENADGGVIITSSHNPEQWNGLKFVDNDSLFFSPERCAELYSLADKLVNTGGLSPNISALQPPPKVVKQYDAYKRHADAILRLNYIRPEEIRAKRFVVCLDAINGAGGQIMKYLLEELGCRVHGLNLEPSGKFAHPPEPLPPHLTALCALVKEHHADLGIAVDPDVDRCVLIDERGEPLGEEYTLALAVQFMMHYCHKLGPVVKNLSSSRAIDKIAESHGQRVYATPVGEIHVAKKMEEVGAVIGGEGNGGVMLPDVHIGRDAPVAAALTLQHLAIHGGTLSELKATLPQYEIVKLKAPLGGMDAEAVLRAIQKEWEHREGVVVNTDDGLHISTAEWWVHLRKSNTEPIVRVIGEGTSLSHGTEICERFMARIKDVAK